MKFIFFSLLIITGTSSQCSTIDKLSTTDEVVAFVKANYNQIQGTEAEKFKIKTTAVLSRELECQGIFKKWDIHNWEKADLNNDGLTDLLLIAEWYGPQPIVILDRGDETYDFIKLINTPFEPCELFKPINIEGKNHLKSYGRKSSRSGLTAGIPNYQIDTLSFFKNTLVRYNPKPKNEAISSIKVTTTQCFGLCPVFSLELTADEMAQFNGMQNTPVIGKHSFKLQQDTFKDLEDLLNYMDVEHLKSNYAVGWTDDQTATLTVTFADGREKTIVDYGMQGTPGLKAVFRKMIGLVQSMNAE
jgi:hypothetical protein